MTLISPDITNGHILNVNGKAAEEKNFGLCGDELDEFGEPISPGWPVYGKEPIEAYDNWIESISHGLVFIDYIAENHGSGIVMVEVGGPGEVLRQVESIVQAGFITSLEDARTPAQKTFDAEHNYVFIPFNMFFEKDWERLSSIIKGTAKVIILKLGGAWSIVPDTVDFASQIISRLLKLLAQEGELLSDMPIMNSPLASEVVEAAKRKDINFSYQCGDGVTSFVRA